jgi:UDP-N-acetylmuramoyl-L-alanyl-D-glutamate--2,6-diaminopimelate ligase
MSVDLAGRRVLVVGLARAGSAAADALLTVGAGVVAFSLEETPDAGRLRANGVEVHVGREEETLLQGIDLVVKSPGVRADAALIAGARAREIPVWDELELGARLLSNPILGVTGTNGKTTVTYLCKGVLETAGRQVGLIGTVAYQIGAERLPAAHTTPGAVELQALLARMADTGMDAAVMEVSSHALALKRTHGVRFAAAVFTNLSREHFDFHKDFEDYFAAKRLLFDQIDRSHQTAVVNIDDEYGRRLAKELGATAMTFGAAGDIHSANDFAISVEGLHGMVTTPRGAVRVESALLGAPNLYNWLGAIGAALVVGIPIPQIEAGIRNLKSVRGRFERVGDMRPTVIVDYAHKPDALEKLLHAVRDIAGPRRVSIVFGCGGDRDRGKRPQMGEIASRLADHVVVTSDNPRSEDPQAIIDEITKGVTATSFIAIRDRREAIARTIAEAGEEDVIVIAGKGHETYQVLGDRVVHFDDREEAEFALKKRNEKSA